MIWFDAKCIHLHCRSSIWSMECSSLEDGLKLVCTTKLLRESLRYFNSVQFSVEQYTSLWQPEICCVLIPVLFERCLSTDSCIFPAHLVECIRYCLRLFMWYCFSFPSSPCFISKQFASCSLSHIIEEVYYSNFPPEQSDQLSKLTWIGFDWPIWGGCGGNVGVEQTMGLEDS